jgi:predicted RND superfamily exporter protein
MPDNSFGKRVAFAVLLLTAFVTPTVLLLALRAIEGNRNNVVDWLPANYEETRQLEWFRRHFLSDQFVLISWEGCQLGNDPSGILDDLRIERLARALKRARVKSSDGSPDVACFKSVTTARTVLQEITQPPAELPYDQAVQRLQGALIGPDGRQTCVLATLTEEATLLKMRETLGRPIEGPLGLRSKVVSPLFQALAEAGLHENEVRLGGPPIDNVAIDEEGERTLVRLALLSGAFGIGLAYWSLRSVRMTATVFACGILSAALSLAMVPLTGNSMDAILMSMPALVYVLSVSGAIHFINYYRLAVQEGGLQTAAGAALHHAWRPALFCSVTTAIGLVSLCTSDITPIAKFGAYSALGVLGMLLVLFGVLPAMLKCWPWMPVGLVLECHEGVSCHGKPHGTREAIWGSLSDTVRRHHLLVLAACLAVVVGLCFGLPRVRTSVDLLKLFHKDAQLLKDYAWFEDRLGRLVPLELVVRFPRVVQQESVPIDAPPEKLVERLSFLERYELVQRVQAAMDIRLGAAGEDLIGVSMSALTFAPEINTTVTGFGQTTRRYAVSEEMVTHRQEFEKSGYLRIDPSTGEELWRVSVRVAAFHNVEHGELVNHVRSSVEPVLAAARSSVQALRTLAEWKGELPVGANVVIWVPHQAGRLTEDLANMLASKRIRVEHFAKPFDQLEKTEFQTLARFDGLIVADDFSPAELARLRNEHVPVVAQLGNSLEEDSTDPDKINVVYTGVVPIVYKAQQALLDSLVQSTWWSFSTIMPLMMFVCRSVLAGAVVMLPNALPVLVVFGGMGWLRIPVDIGSMMAASIALGVAVDDTIHFLAWYRDDVKRIGDRRAAVKAAYLRSATPTLQAALINGLGLAVFATSSFTPTQRFGWLMLTILLAGVIAELVMLPALLYSPLGSVFRVPPKTVPPTSVVPEPRFVAAERKRRLRQSDRTRA